MPDRSALAIWISLQLESPVPQQRLSDGGERWLSDLYGSAWRFNRGCAKRSSLVGVALRCRRGIGIGACEFSVYLN